MGATRTYRLGHCACACTRTRVCLHMRRSMSPYRQCVHICSCYGIARVESALEFAVDMCDQFYVYTASSEGTCERFRAAVVRTHSMWRLDLPWISLRVRVPYAMIPLAVYVCCKQGPHRLVVRTSRRGRDKPGSTPGAVLCSMLTSVL